jgi:hypothetical protein
MMAFSKKFPREVDGSNYPRWEEISLTDEEEKEQEQRCRQESIRLMKECTGDAKLIMEEKGMKEYQSDLISLAISLFEKRSSHAVYWKENKCKEKFDALFGKK